MSIATLGGQISDLRPYNIHGLMLRSRFDNNKAVEICGLESETVTASDLPIISETWNLNPIADHIEGNLPRSIEMLIGADHLAQIDLDSQRSFGDILATNTIFGWVFCGPESKGTSLLSSVLYGKVDQLQPATILSRPAESSPNIVLTGVKPRAISDEQHITVMDLQMLWKSESLGLDDKTQEEEKDTLNEALIEHFKETIKRDPDGRYIVSSFLKKLSKKPTELKAVDDEVANYLAHDFIERASPRKPDQMAHYLPIQAVFKTSPAAPLGLKTRLVKDASARKVNEAGLNDILHVGPFLLPNLLKVYIKFRRYKYTLTADIEKAFLQFKVAEAHRTFLRFFWPLGISTNPQAKIVEFWATRLDFGLVCSPFIHCQGIRHHLEQAARSRPKDKEFIREILETFYMDDCVFGSDSFQDAQSKIRVLFEVFQDGHFPLKKWQTNCESLGDFIQKISPVEAPEVKAGKADAKFLGICWNQETDKIHVSVKGALSELSSGVPSKRRLLRGIPQIFDPLRILSPSIIAAKVLLQQLWKTKLDWDSPLTGTCLEAYNNFLSNLHKIEGIALDRHYTLGSEPNRMELHIFDLI
ncbi:uncharacterized protein LOC100903446 [Galendromus occidentalis]|uniref:Uncharacterized protein LOC100903446 n=1 Tax=Galendromus occidentalis TaxID=34638 RepID=A0AAJ6QLD5_9ACAR|nr:uncharacterized protein LOC100903446 [Galendromus occidentalis]